MKKAPAAGLTPKHFRRAAPVPLASRIMGSYIEPLMHSSKWQREFDKGARFANPAIGAGFMTRTTTWSSAQNPDVLSIAAFGCRLCGAERDYDWKNQDLLTAIIKVIYGVGKQFSDTLSVTDPQKQAFKKAVLVNSFNGNGWMVGFVTGTIKDQNGEELLKVFVPSSPHPLTGIVFLVKPSQTLDCGWTVEEALKMVVSVGIISPEEIKKIS